MFLPGFNYTWIAEQEPRATLTCEFLAIPQGFDDLAILMLGGLTDAATTTRQLTIFFNEDFTASNYARASLWCAGTTAAGASAQTSDVATLCSQAGLGAADFRIWIPDYSNASVIPIVQSMGVVPNHTSTAGHASVQYLQYHTQWVSTAAIERIRFVVDTDEFAAPTKFILYGVRYGS